jgi:hypothetical protein
VYLRLAEGRSCRCGSYDLRLRLRLRLRLGAKGRRLRPRLQFGPARKAAAQPWPNRNIGFTDS